jgi:hypothetical protein
VKNAVWLSLACLLVCSSLAYGVQFDSVSIGFHIIPSVERLGDTRPMDVSLSIGTTLLLDPENSIDLLAMVDSKPSSLGVSAQFNHPITDILKTGLGVNVLWPFSQDNHLEWPILGMYAHAAARTYFYPEFWGESSISFPLLTLANLSDRWNLLPLSELPTLALSADVRVVAEASIQTRVTFQPVITDTTVLQNPLGRISDDLLVISMGSVFLRYLR